MLADLSNTDRFLFKTHPITYILYFLPLPSLHPPMPPLFPLFLSFPAFSVDLDCAALASISFSL